MCFVNNVGKILTKLRWHSTILSDDIKGHVVQYAGLATTSNILMNYHDTNPISSLSTSATNVGENKPENTENTENKNISDTMKKECISSDKIYAEEEKPLKRIKKYYEYFTHAVYDLLPQNELNKRPKYAPFVLRIAEEELADKILENILPYRKSDVPLFEVNPGPGLLTKKLFDANIPNIPHLRLIESNIEYMDVITKICQSQGQNIVHSLHLISKQFALDIDHSTILSGIEYKDWDDDITFQVIICTGTTCLFKKLIANVVNKTEWFQHGRSEFFVCVPLSTLQKLAGSINSEPTALNTKFHIFFEYQVLTKLNQKSFFPWGRNEYVTDMYLIRMHPRRDLHDLCSSEDLPELLTFINQYYRPKKGVISVLENWIPGIGANILLANKTVELEVIGEPTNTDLSDNIFPSTTMSNQNHYPNYTIFTKFKDISPSQLLSLFVLTKATREYQDNMIGALQNIEDNTPINPRQKIKRVSQWPNLKT